MKTSFHLVLSSLTALLILMAGTVWAASNTTNLATTKHRSVEDSQAYPFSAIGTVNWAGVSQRSSCTGTLIAEDLVVTAAHCLMNKRTGKMIGPGLIHFSAGYHKGERLAHTTAEKIYTKATFKLTDKISNKMIKQDWAIIKLKEPLGKKAGYLGWAVFNQDSLKTIISPKGKVMVAGYPRDRLHVLSTEFKCKLSMSEDDIEVLRHSCKIVEGDSGGPVAIMYKGHATLIGINSASASNGVNYAVTLASAEEFLKELLNEDKKISKEQAKRFTKGSPPIEAVQ